MNCNCISRVETNVAAKYTESLGVTAEAGAQNVGFNMAGDQIVTAMYMPMKIKADAPGFRNGKKINLYFSFCPFCGTSTGVEGLK